MVIGVAFSPYNLSIPPESCLECFNKLSHFHLSTGFFVLCVYYARKFCLLLAGKKAGSNSSTTENNTSAKSLTER